MRFRRYPQNRGPRTHCEEEGGEAHSFSMHMSDALRTGTVSAALNGIVKIIKAQNFSVFFVKKIIRMKFHNIAGKFASLWCGFAFTGFS